jgi:hypothetical protein
MTVRRDGTYVWVTWLSRLMAGDSSCEWGAWFKSHFQGYAKAPSDFDLAAWTIKHTRLLRELRIERQAAGEQTLIEGQGQFYYERPSTGLVVSGKPDLLAISGDTVCVYDAKTGQPRTGDTVQVMIYMYCIPRANPAFQTKTVKGAVVYQDNRVEIPPGAVNEEFERNFNYFLDILDSDVEPSRVPSPSDCRFCDVGRPDCPDRVDAAPAREDAVEPL